MAVTETAFCFIRFPISLLEHFEYEDTLIQGII